MIFLLKALHSIHYSSYLKSLNYMQQVFYYYSAINHHPTSFLMLFSVQYLFALHPSSSNRFFNHLFPSYCFLHPFPSNFQSNYTYSALLIQTKDMTNETHWRFYYIILDQYNKNKMIQFDKLFDVFHTVFNINIVDYWIV
jgi:hypothetical protein